MISVEALTKEYEVEERSAGVWAAAKALFHRPTKVVRAVDAISFSIDGGERVGFLGPNGAGKTTTLKVLSGLLHPTSGRVRVDGHEPQKRSDVFLKSIMLVLGQKQQLLWDLPPVETFELNRAIYGVSREACEKTVKELVELLELGDLVKKPTRQLSLGERMKCELVATLIHQPKVLFMDEPTIGLDVSMQVALRSFIKEYNERHGATLLLTSHDMDDVAALCPRVILIDHGKISFDGPLEGLVERMRPEKRIVLRLAKPVDEKDIALIGEVVRHDVAEAVLKVNRSQVNDAVARALSSLPVRDLTVENPPLEEIMSEIFKNHGTPRS